MAYDMIVVGAGIIGASISLALTRAGASVLCVDRNPAAGYGSTSSSSAIIRTTYSNYDSCALAWEGVHVWREWSEFLGAHIPSDTALAAYTECGMIVLESPGSTMMDASCKHLSKLDIPWERLDRSTLADRFPGIDTHTLSPARWFEDPMFGDLSGAYLESAIYAPDAGYVNDPLLAAQNIYMAAKAEGAVFCFGAEVTDILNDNGRVQGVLLSDGERIEAPVVVNAAGPFSAQLNAMAGISMQLPFATRPLRAEVCHLPRPEPLTNKTAEPFVLLDMDGGTYVRSDAADTLFIGGTEPECDPLEWIDNPEDFNASPGPQWTAQAYRAALRVPDLQIPGQAKGVTALYDVTPDWTPVYDRSPLDGFYLAIGTSGNQFKNGPVAGELMAGLIAYCEQGGDHDAAPYQHDCMRTGNKINTGSFSRLRTINASISNVMG
ncbi:oxidoreductase [Kordiimonas sediminis]|uniref:Oxidoreductase n=1 Tax=Kordiimonas sediminis TaxID=1735581 RepID=A0A919AST9_9PROT|nr:FAD-binding oxidoreductase [Kordiimonas sediminis]GHF25233.1 oxidoreductase [Kordiimonas sediminis]